MMVEMMVGRLVVQLVQLLAELTVETMVDCWEPLRVALLVVEMVVTTAHKSAVLMVDQMAAMLGR